MCAKPKHHSKTPRGIPMDTNPSHPSPVRAQQAWMCHWWSLIEVSFRNWEISATVMHSFTSCLLAKISNPAFFKSWGDRRAGNARAALGGTGWDTQQGAQSPGSNPPEQSAAGGTAAIPWSSTKHHGWGVKLRTFCCAPPGSEPCAPCTWAPLTMWEQWLQG